MEKNLRLVETVEQIIYYKGQYINKKYKKHKII
jgi:hypothetical protein